MPKKPLTLAPTKVPQLPAIPSDASPSVKAWMTAMKEALEIRLGRVGDQRDRAITLRELISSGLAKDLSVRPYDPNNPNDFTWFVDPPDLTIPPKPTNFSASGAFTRIILSWTEGWTVFMNFSHTEIYRHTSNSLGDAAVINITQAGVYTDTVDYNTTMYYWVRHVSTSEVKGPFSDSAHATTAIDIGAEMTALSEELSALPGYNTLINTSVPNLISTGTMKIIKNNSAPTARADGSALQGQDIWIDTNDNNQMYVRNAANNAWEEARDGSLVTLVNSHTQSIGTTTYTGASITAAMYTAQTENGARAQAITDLNAVVIVKNQTFVHGSSSNLPAAVAVGDLLIRTDENNKMYRASAIGNSNWVALPVDTNTTFAQNDAPGSSGLITGDLWVDTNSDPVNKLHRWDGDSWEPIEDARLSSSADAVESLSTAVGLVDAEATKITALQASIGNIYGARVITTDNSNNVKVETMVNTANTTTTATHGISDADVTAGIFLTLKNSAVTGGLTTQQLNKTFKVTSRINTTQLQVAVVGTAATSAATSATVANGATIGTNAGLAQLATVTADIEGNAHSSYVLQVNANDSVGGMVIEANSSVSGDNSGVAVQFRADKFAIWDATGSTAGSASVAPFIVSGGNVFMSNAMIQNAAITNAKIADATIESAKIGDLAVTRLKVAASTITEEKIFDLTVTGAKIKNATITNLHVREGTFEKAKIASLYAHSISGDVSKSVAGGLANSIDFDNRLAAVSTYGWFDVLNLSLPKPTHPDGWAPYATFNINRVETDKNSWYHVMLEMAVWNVNSTGGTAVEQPNDLDGDNNGICLTQQPNASSGALTIAGALASSGSVTLSSPRRITITTAAADSGRTFTIIGTNSSDQSQTETITTINASASEGESAFKTITSVTADLDADGISVAAAVADDAALVIGGALASGGACEFFSGRKVTILSAGNDSGIAFSVVGIGVNGADQTESVTGANAGTATSSNLFRTIRSITAVGDPAGNVSAGVNATLEGNVVVGISALISIHGSGYSAGTIYHDYLQFTPTYSLSNSTLTITGSVFIQNTNSEAGGTTALTPGLIASTSHYVSDGTTRRQITNWTLLNGNYIFNYTDSDSAPVSGWSGSQALYFSAAITAGSTGPYVRKSLIDWIAVDSAYNDFTIAGVWSNTAASANVPHGVKAKLSYRSNHSGSWEQDVATMTLHEATGFLMGVR